MHAFFEMPSPIILSVEGRDALRYLNARLTNDARKVVPAQGCLAAALTPQGRTEGLFVVLRNEDDSYLLVCDGGEREIVRTAFCRYIVADRVTTTDLSDSYRLVHIVTAQEGPWPGVSHEGPAFQVIQLPEFRLIRRPRIDAVGFDALVPREHSHALFSSGSVFKQLPPEEVDFRRIRSGLPVYPQEINIDALFLESGLTGAVSFNKGCYVGQEVIERTDALGKLGKHLARITFPGEIPKVEGEMVLREDGSKAGVVRTVARAPERDITLTFATLRTDVLSGHRVTVAGHSGTVF